MEDKERYYYKKILRDCVMPEGLFEIKDRESNFYLIIENKKDVDTITNLLNEQDKRIKELELLLKADKKIKSNSLNGFEKLRQENQQLKQQIADLEAKLAESEKKYAELFCRNIELETLYSQKTALLNFYKDTDLVEENQQLKEKLEEIEESARAVIDANFKIVEERDKLKQQLAEKDRQLKLAEELLIKQEKEYDEQLEKQASIHYRHLKEKDQDKISFAVEQLEKLKRTFIDVAWEDVDFAIEIIDDQIKELKGIN